MLTDFLRDHAFAAMWLALMAAMWLGWAQEDPRPSWRPLLGAGSVLGLLTAVAMGLLVWRNWTTATALDGKYWVFGLLVLAEVLLIGGGCLVLARRGRSRWFAWWIGLCVAVHFIPLAWIFGDWSYLVLAAVQCLGLLVLRPRISSDDHSSSRLVGPWMGSTFLVFALVSATLLVVRHGYPW